MSCFVGVARVSYCLTLCFGIRVGRMEGSVAYRVAVLGRKALGLKAAWRADEKILDILAGCGCRRWWSVVVVDVEELRGWK